MKLNFFLFFIFLVFTLSSCGKYDFNSAVKYHEEGDYDKALLYYKKSIDSNTNADISLKYSGDIYFAQGKFEKAFESYRQSIEINPNLALYETVTYLSYGNLQARKACIEMLPRIKNPAARQKLLVLLANMLHSEKQYERTDAFEAVHKLGISAAPITKDIVSLLDDENPVIKKEALDFISVAPAQAVKFGALEKIKNILKHENELIKISAIECLGNMKKYAAICLPELVNITEENKIFRKASFNAIKKIGPPSKQQAEFLKDYLVGKSFSTKALALSLLSGMGPEANDFVPDIILLLKDKDPKIVQYARETLAKVGPASDKAVDGLILLLDDPNKEVKLRAISELADIGDKASAAIGPLIRLTKSKDSTIKTYAESAVIKIQTKLFKNQN